MLPELLRQIAGQTWLDWAITFTALAYVYLAAKENSWCWVWGIASCSMWAYADFARYNLWVDGVLQLFYVGMGFMGLYAWRFGGEARKPLHIRELPFNRHLLLWSIGGAMTLLLGWLFDRYTPTALPYPDSFITAFSIIATLLTVRKVLESWLYWIVVDALAVFLFLAREAVLVAVVMAIYALIAVYGYRNWKNKQNRQNLV